MDMLSFALGAASAQEGGGPGQDPYLYENCTVLNLSKDENTWTDNPTITIDCAHMTTLANLCYTTTNPGYKKVKLKNIPATGIPLNSMCCGHESTSAFESLELDGDLIGVAPCQAVFYNCRSLKSITGGRLDLSAATNLNNFAKRAYALETISFVPSSIKVSITFEADSNLTDASVISIVNGLDGNAIGQTLTLDSTVKAKLSGIMGTVTDGVFSEDAGGDTNLLDFATITKGWSIS